MNHPKIIIVGGGIAGLMAALKIAETGCPVQLLSQAPIIRSNSVCSHEGLNAAIDSKKDGDSPEIHFNDTIYGGDFLANQELPRQMCYQAPEILNLFNRMGALFNRTPEGGIDFCRQGGSSYHRTAFAGCATGQQLFYALDRQVRRFEACGLVEKYEGWEFLSLVKDGQGICRGLCAIQLSTMKIKTFPSDAIIFCSGSPGLIFGTSTNSILSSGSAASSLYQQGAYYANGEFIQVYPTVMPGVDKGRAITEAARGEGGRVWVYKDDKPWYFLEEWFPDDGNLVPRDVASRAIHKVIYELDLGVEGKPLVYLDLTHLPPKLLEKKLGGLLESYHKFTGEDPKKSPMKVTPEVHYSMGGLWTDENHMTNIPGVFAAGDGDYHYHGANSLGGNSLLSCIFGGMKAAETARRFALGLEKGCHTIDSSLYSNEIKRQWSINQEFLDGDGLENVHQLHQELEKWMRENVTVVRCNEQLKLTDDKIQELKERLQRITLSDREHWMNQELLWARRFQNMLELARVITLGALARNESRGAHYKPEFPGRDDQNFLKTTKASWTPEGPKLEYEDVNLKYIKPRPRRYDVASNRARVLGQSL